MKAGRDSREGGSGKKPDDWSETEINATITDYFAMLEFEIHGRLYSKADHRRALIQMLNGRSAAAIEFKHSNISAVLNDLGLQYIAGYKPRRKYQDALYQAVKHYIDSR